MNARTSSNLRDSAAGGKSDPEPSAHDLKLGGLTPFTTIDFPGRLAAVLYTQGCDWRCRYCHNPHLWSFAAPGLSFADAVRFLEPRKGFLDGVVFCGGEPTAQEALPAAMRMLRSSGFQVALHTTGMYPDRLAAVLKECDWVGMDVKAPFGSYEKITRVAGGGTAARRSAELLLGSGIEHEFRMTVHRSLLSEADILEAAEALSAMGAARFVLQLFQPRGCVDEELREASAPAPVSDRLRSALSGLFEDFQVRG